MRVRSLLILTALLSCLLPAGAAQATWPGKNGAIAFWRSHEGGQGDIWVEEPSGKQRRLTYSARSEGDPVFSPDGRTIAFVSFHNDGSDIWLMNSDDRRIVVTRVEDLGSVPDNTHMAMMTPRGTFVPGAPRTRPGFLVGDASWQPLR